MVERERRERGGMVDVGMVEGERRRGERGRTVKGERITSCTSEAASFSKCS